MYISIQFKLWSRETENEYLDKLWFTNKDTPRNKRAWELQLFGAFNPLSWGIALTLGEYTIIDLELAGYNFIFETYKTRGPEWENDMVNWGEEA